MNPMQYAIYKGTGGKHGAVQFNFQRPHYYNGKQKDFVGELAFEVKDGKRVLKDGWQQREGAIFLEITSTKDKNVYDWENKVVIALSIDDMGKLLETLVTGNECKLVHDPGAKSESAGVVKKFLTLSSPKGIKEGCIISCSMQSGGETKNHMVPISPSEVLVLRSLLQSAIAKSLNW
jgi:hypothetical protein